MKVQRRRFIADAMLGKLTKWLRILGLDVAYESAIDDQTLVRRARIEGREILTRDRRLLEHRWSGRVRFRIINDDQLPRQIEQVRRELRLTVSTRLLSRCVECNERLTPLRREEAAHRVPVYIWRTQKHFAQCPACGRLYWQGTHYQQILRRLKVLMPNRMSARKVRPELRAQK